MVRRDIVANFLGRSWAMLMGIAFVPVYLAILGPEAYGLIGFYATLQAVLIIADFGLSWTITRELSRAPASGAGKHQLASLLRTLEIAYWLIAILAGAAVSIIGGALSERWFRSNTLSTDEIRQTLQLMGVVLALQMPSLFYQGALNGFDRQPTTNLIASLSAMLRWGGAALVVWLVSPTVHAFFAWQVVAAAVGTGITAWAAWRNVAGEFRRASFDPRVLRQVWRFTFGILASAVAGVLAMQVDKLVLSRLVTLEQFGYYSLAVLLASLVPALVTPFHTAFFPRFSQAHAQGDWPTVSRLYHSGSQLLSMLIVPTALVLVFFPHELLLVWTGTEAAARNAGTLLSLLALGNLLYSLAGFPNLMLFAAGLPMISATVLIVLAACILPSLLVFAPRFGPIAAAIIWVVASAAYLLAIVPATHRRLLGGELLRWCTSSVLVPVAVASAVFAVAHWLMPADGAMPVQLFFVACAWTIATLCVAIALPEIRQRLAAVPMRSRGA
ncbi:MAG: hypothetical protein BGO72_11865 [Burkholderiales bacterium 70-64]|nr:MAG: hypothetical protein BGO72_11865 [Burkholderiales bacterium 70-64]